MQSLGEGPTFQPAAPAAERLARRAVGLALDPDVSLADAARLLVGESRCDGRTLEAARLRILRAASGPTSQRAGRAVWMAQQLLEAHDHPHRAVDARRVLIVGKPGAGKGTQGTRLAQALDVPHIAMGDLIRDVAREQTPFGFQARLFMERGLLVPDSLVLEIIARRFSADDVRRDGFVLDGYPRTIEQAVALEALLGSSPVELVIELVVSTDVARERLQLRGRSDDNRGAVTRRLDEFEQWTAPVAYWYRARAEVWSIDGERSHHDVTDELAERIVAWTERRHRPRGHPVEASSSNHTVLPSP
jgi:adenylate kinase